MRLVSLVKPEPDGGTDQSEGEGSRLHTWAGTPHPVRSYIVEIRTSAWQQGVEKHVNKKGSTIKAEGAATCQLRPDCKHAPWRWLPWLQVSHQIWSNALYSCRMLCCSEEEALLCPLVVLMCSCEPSPRALHGTARSRSSMTPLQVLIF